MSHDDELSEYPIENVHRLIEPGPVVLVSTAGEDGPNLMTNGFNMPVVHGGALALVLGPWDHSYAALRRTRECVVAIPSADIAEKVVDVGNTTGAEIDKWERFGFTPLPARQVVAPLVAECFANIECRVVDDRLVEGYHLWILEPVQVWLDERRRGSGELHHRGDGTFSTNGRTLDLRSRMTRWHYLTT
ncbi:MAG TPA: flavin reductase family protein [Jiangellaceae bacterium]